MRISHHAIDRPRVVLVLVALVIVGAILSGVTIPVQRTPAIHTAVVLVSVPYPGAQPEEVEEEITRKIEDALQRLDQVDFIASTSMRGSSVTQVIFLDGVDATRARDDVAHLVNEVRRELPMGREIQPIIVEIDFESSPIMLVSLIGPEGFDPRALKQTAEDIQEELEVIDGVANTQLFGGREREFHIDVNPDLLAEQGLSIPDVSRAVHSFHAQRPGGSLETGQFDFRIRNETRLRSIEQIRAIIVSGRDGRLIRVGDIAEVTDTHRRLLNVAQIDGRSAATIVVSKEANINTLGAARAIKQRVAELQEQYPHIQFSTTRDVSADIRTMFWVLGSSAVFGGALVAIVLAWSLGLRISVLVVTAIPFSAAIGLIFLRAAGIPISNMVLFSFVLVLGMVVDGAIIVAENIHRHIERGEPPIEAAKIGIDEVGVPVIAADLTTVAAFLPMVLVPGIMGDFMGMLPRVVSAALLGSVLVDHFLIPVLAAYWYKQKKLPKDGDTPAVGVAGVSHDAARIRPNLGRGTLIYAATLRYCLANRWVVCCCCVLSLVWAWVMLDSVGKEFFPKSDRGQFEINYELPLGSSIDRTLAASRVFTEPLLELRETGELEHFVTAVGSSAGLATRLETDPTSGPEFGKIMVQLVSPTDRQRHQSVIIEELRERIGSWPGIKYKIEEVEEGPPGGSDVAVRLTGKDLAQLGAAAERIKQRLDQIKGAVDVSTDYRPDSPELIIDPNTDLLGHFNLTESDVATTIQTAVLGDTTIQLSLDDEDVTLRIQVAPEYRRSIQSVRRLMLTAPDGRKATVGQLAETRHATGLYAVNRWERRRAVTARCNLRGEGVMSSDEVFAMLRGECLPQEGFRPVKGDVKTWIGRLKNAMAEWGFHAASPPATTFSGNPLTSVEGVRAEFTGENEERDENMEYMSTVMLVGVMLIFAILAIQFNSIRQTVVVLVAVPLSFVGVVFGLWICRHAFSLSSFIGLIALAGIVVNDAIVLVDFTNQARRRGLPITEAIIEAGVNRLRPVLLTTATTIGGLLPLFLNLSGGAEFWGPLTGAVIFGLAFATVLTLVVIPVGYSLVHGRAE